MKFDGINSSSADYRYGYQGEYAEDEGTEAGIQTNSFQLRLYNPRLGRWLSPDPYGQFHNPYLAMGNNPINMVDPDGGWCYDVNGNKVPCGDLADVFGNEDAHTSLLSEVELNLPEVPINKPESNSQTLLDYSITGFSLWNLHIMSDLEQYTKEAAIIGEQRPSSRLNYYNSTPLISGNGWIYNTKMLKKFRNAQLPLKIGSSIGYGLSVLSVLSSSYKYSQGEISGMRYGFDLSFVASAEVVGVFAGSSAAFAYGGIAGSAIMAYDKGDELFNVRPRKDAPGLDGIVWRHLNFHFALPKVTQGFGMIK